MTLLIYNLKKYPKGSLAHVRTAVSGKSKWKCLETYFIVLMPMITNKRENVLQILTSQWIPSATYLSNSLKYTLTLNHGMY